MPVIVDPDSGSVRRLLGALPPGCQSVDSIERLLPWLSQHSDEYVIVLGPNVRFDDAITDLDSIAGAVTRAHQFSVALRGPGQAEHQGSVIAVFSPKGGVGKTTIAVNLALALTDKGSRQVCLVDFDLAFGDVAITLQLFPTHTIEHAIGSEGNVDVALLESLLARYQDSLKVLPAPSHPDVRERISPTLISQTLTTLRTMFD